MSLLPQSKTQAETSISQQIILIYGKPKIGKSTLCSCFDNAVFLATEPGLNHLEVFKVNINSWDKLLDALKELSSGEHQFKTIIIDTIDNLVTYCQDYVCKREGIKHPTDFDYGKGWSMVTQELHRVLTKMSLLPYGLVMIGHAKNEEVKTKTKSYNKSTITVTGGNRNVVLSMSDIILFMDEDEEDDKPIGIIRCKPSIYFDAGDRSGLLPDSIKYDLSKPQMAYDKINSFFKAKEKK